MSRSGGYGVYRTETKKENGKLNKFDYKSHSLWLFYLKNKCLSTNNSRSNSTKMGSRNTKR